MLNVILRIFRNVNSVLVDSIWKKDLVQNAIMDARNVSHRNSVHLARKVTI